MFQKLEVSYAGVANKQKELITQGIMHVFIRVFEIYA
jgi:hypothetical protein